jgi:hypothetical protein
LWREALARPKMKVTAKPRRKAQQKRNTADAPRLPMFSRAS